MDYLCYNQLPPLLLSCSFGTVAAAVRREEKCNTDRLA